MSRPWTTYETHMVRGAIAFLTLLGVGTALMAAHGADTYLTETNWLPDELGPLGLAFIGLSFLPAAYIQHWHTKEQNAKES